MYIPKNIIKKFVEEFHRNLIQGYNGAIALIRRLEKEYVIHKIYIFIKQMTKEYPDC